MNWILINHLHELLHIAAATFFIAKGIAAIWEYRTLRSGFVISYSAMCLCSAVYAIHVVISHNLPKFGEFWIPWTTAGLVVTFLATFLYLLTLGNFLAIHSRLFNVPLVLLGTITIVVLIDLLQYAVAHHSFLFLPVPREGIPPHQFALGEGAYSLRIIAEILPVIFIISIVMGVGYLLIHLIRIRSTDVLIYIGLTMMATIIINESLVALSVYEGVYLLAFTKAFEAQRIYLDINKRSLMQFENSLRREEKRELEQRVQIRTAQLKAVNKELEAFAYSVSHDLSAPLRSINGFSRVLLEEYSDKLDQKGKDYFNRIIHAVQKMSQLIDDMLKLSRVIRSDMNIRDIDLSKIANEISGELRKSDPDRQVQFKIQTDISIHADARLLTIVMQNLLGNAWKFTSKLPVAQIEFGMFREEGKDVCFVKDNGAGFEMKYVSKLFDAFQRLHDSNAFPGTGIGLATVQRIIHRHGGDIWAKGEIEKGATFYFTIPCR